MKNKDAKEPHELETNLLILLGYTMGFLDRLTDRMDDDEKEEYRKLRKSIEKLIYLHNW